MRSGQKIGPFEVERRLGSGGMAEVWLAKQEQTGLRVALKVLKEASTELFNEARAHASLQHHHIVQLYDYGQDPQPFLSMERMDGTLRDILPLKSFEHVRSVLGATLSALSYAHARGVIHRDLKPENILYKRVGNELVLKLADFGIAHAFGDRHKSDGYSSAGTPLYMAPEQFFGDWRDLGPWTDLYAFGCMMVELVCGKPPFSGSLSQLAFKHLHEAVEPANELIPVPEGFWELTQGLLSKLPATRYEHAADVLAELLDLPTVEGSNNESSDFVPLDTVATLSTQDWVYSHTEPMGEVTQKTGKGEVPDVRETPAKRPIRRHFPPSEWTGPTPGRAGLELAGLGLFALREVPVVGVDRTRDELWTEFVRTSNSGRPRVVNLESVSEDSAWRLSKWVSVYAAELGAARVFEIRATPSRAPHEGIVGLANDIFRTWDIGDETLLNRARKFGAGGELLGMEILGRLYSQHDALPGRAEKLKAASRILAELAEARPIILLVRGVQFDDELPELISEVSALDAPILVLTCAWDEAPPGTHKVLIQAHDPELSRAQISAMLPLNDALVDELSAICGDDQEFARQALANLVERGALSVLDDSLALRTDVILPKSAPELFVIRLDRVLRRLKEEAQTAQICLEIAGVLGIAPSNQEIRAVCARLHIPFSPKLVEMLLDSGLAQGDEKSWYFSHREIVECIRARARVQGRWSEIQEAAAGVLRELATPDSPANYHLRIARHFESAGRVDDALLPFYYAIALEIQDQKPVRKLLEDRAALLSRAHKDHYQFHLLLQKRLIASLRLQESKNEGRQLLKDVIESCEAEPRGLELPYAEALKALGSDLSLDEPREGLRYFARALEVYTAQELPLEMGKVLLGMGFIKYRLGEIDSAVESFSAAAEHFFKSGSRKREAQALAYSGHALGALGKFETAMQELEKSANISRTIHDRYGEFLAEHAVAVTLRRLGKYSESREKVDAVLFLSKDLNAHEKAISRLNDALLTVVEDGLLAREKFEALLEESLDESTKKIARAAMSFLEGDALPDDAHPDIKYLLEIRQRVGSQAD